MVSSIPDNIFKQIEEVADTVSKQRIRVSSGRSYIPGGVNGPYFDLETPVRNTSHWLITFSVLYKLTERCEYKGAALQLLDFLLHTKIFKKGNIYIQRQKEGKDWVNGVIGQAWVTEALDIAGRIFNQKEALAQAKECADSLQFDKNIGAWYRPSIQSYKSQIDYTLNHQLWYAAAKAQVLGGNYNEEIDCFLKTLDDGAFKTRKNGQICHLFYAKSLKGLLLQGRYKLAEQRNRQKVFEKEAGYHLYNLHPLARLKHYYPEHKFFKNQKFIESLQFVTTEKFKQSLKDNPYSYAYNSPAFELPLIYEVFKKELCVSFREEIDFYINEQINLTFDKNINQFSVNNSDSLTLSARLYELLVNPLYLSDDSSI